MTLVIVERACPFHGITYPVGSEIELPSLSALRLSKTRPPFVRIVSEAKLEKLTKPKPKPRAAKPKAGKGKGNVKADA